MSAEVDAVCGAAYGQAVRSGPTAANGYRPREFDTRAHNKAVPDQVRSLGSIDAVIHNAGIYESGGRGETLDGLERTFQEFRSLGQSALRREIHLAEPMSGALSGSVPKVSRA
jgi:hypothetical protein